MRKNRSGLGLLLALGFLALGSGCNSGKPEESGQGPVSKSLAPSGLTYSALRPVYRLGEAISPNLPSITGGAVNGYRVDRSLPPGLNLNPTTGEVTGTPSSVAAPTDYTITAYNVEGSSDCVIQVQVVTNPLDPRHPLRQELRRGAPGPVETAAQYIHLVRLPENASQEEKEEMCGLISDTRDFFFGLNPTAQQITQLIEEHLGYSEVEVNLAIALKTGVLLLITNQEWNLIRNIDDYIRVIGDNFANRALRMNAQVDLQNFHYLNYKNQNTDLLYMSFADLSGRGFLSAQDLQQLGRYIQEFQPRDAEERANQQAMTQGIANRIAAKPARTRRQVLEQLDARIRGLLANGVEAHAIPGGPIRNAQLGFYCRATTLGQEPVAPVPGERQCAVCYGEVDPAAGICCEQPGCGQSLCADCLPPTLQAARAQGAIPLACGNRHEYRIPEARLAGYTVEQLQDLRRAILKAYFERLVVQGDLAHPDYKICRGRDCGSFVERANVDPANHHYHCQACGERACYDCNEASHVGMTCQAYRAMQNQDEDALNAMLHDPASQLRPCPFCLAPTQRNDGCHSVNCGNRACRKQWNWVRGKPRAGSYTHDFPNGQPQPRLYRVPGDPGYVAGRDMECAYPPGDGAITR